MQSSHQSMQDSPANFSLLPQSTHYRLTHLAQITIAGHQASEYLQGQLAVDVNQPQKQMLPMSFCCARQGRLVGLFFYHQSQQLHTILCHHSVAEVLVRRLQQYILSKDVQLDVGYPTVWDLPIGAEANGAVVIPIPHWSRQLCIGDQQQTAYMCEHSEWHWHNQLLHHGIPLLTYQTVNQFFAHELKLGRFDLIHLNKGCYLGQEIVARMHYLGKSKYCLVLWQDKILLAPGQAIKIEAQTIGTVVDSTAGINGDGALLLGIIKNDKVSHLEKQIIKIF